MEDESNKEADGSSHQRLILQYQLTDSQEVPTLDGL